MVLCGGLIMAAQQSAPVPLAESARQLFAIKTDEMETAVPSEARTALHSFKDGLEREALAVLSTAEGTPALDRLNEELEKRLHRAGTLCPGRSVESREGYGLVCASGFERLPDRPEWISLLFTLLIPCGDDSVLILFHRETAGWKTALRVRADGYEQISGALGSFRYQISPPDSSGKFFVVTAAINPWCTSAWQMVHFQALRPGTDAEHATLLYKGDSSIYLGVDNPLSLHAGVEGFKLKFYERPDLATDRIIRKRVFTVAIKGDHAQRIGPIAESPASFLDEWLTLDWKDAVYWVKPELRKAAPTNARPFSTLSVSA